MSFCTSRDNIYDCVDMLLQIQNIILALDAQVKISNQIRLKAFIRQQIKKP